MKMKNLFTAILSYLALFVTIYLPGQSASSTPQYIFLNTPGEAKVGSTLGATYYKGLNNNGVVTTGAILRTTVTQKPNNSIIPTTFDFLTGLSEFKSRFQINDNGLIGINTNKPNALLSINQFENDFQVGKLLEIVGGPSKSNLKSFIISSDDKSIVANLQGHLLLREGSAKITDGDMEVDRGNLFVSNGKLAVGVLNNELMGDHKVYVDGSIICTELTVDLKTNWPDYVFKKGYPLMSIEDLQKFIAKESHLPGIPDCKDIEKNGIAIGQMQKALLEKIEELTLYIIQQNNKISELERKILTKN